MFRKSMLLMGMLALGVAPVTAQDSGSAGPAIGTDPVPDVVLRVDGLACPFCAAGLQKKLEALDATDEIDVRLDDGQVLIYLKAGHTVGDDELTEAVKHAGFALRAIQRAEAA